jgi:dimethylargininase
MAFQHLASRLRHARPAQQRSKSLSDQLRSVFTLAICRDLPTSFGDALAVHGINDNDDETGGGVSLDLAQSQHEHYVNVLRQHVPTICLPALEEYPDCSFVEDTVVAIGKVVCVTRPGAPSRRGEVDSIATIIRQFGMTNVTNMADCHRDAFCDGGDALYTGRHLFVGLSDRTTQAGIDVLRETFDNMDIPVITVPPVAQGKNVLHLKSAVTSLDESTLLVPEGAVGDRVLDAMQASKFGYRAVRLPDVLTCNVVVINGHAIVQDTKCEISRQRITEAVTERGMQMTFVDTSELAKKDAALTCGSVLLSL